jgi:hypothetical protein
MHGFNHYLLGLKGQFVQLERGGPDACQGWVQSVQVDYLTLRCTEGGELHLPLRHIRSVTPLPPPAESICPSEIAVPPTTVTELLVTNRGKHLRLYYSGPEMSIGILRECAEDHLLLEVTPSEVICYSLFHIRSIYVLESENRPIQLFKGGDGSGTLDTCSGNFPVDSRTDSVAPERDA